ncbi:alpha/beta hydrolase [Limnoglobus roseus]|uniref:Alpha/beta hydrolase n=1 Tax=Limnoglobus roseus TaxID=2598579 RepID=A0A5C1ALI7_9BACT|nr:acetylxylan esterase [Limnoglobus roseus]QEL18836.1 alpha/beta hydrolase [Limnoglobus roseus]
MLTRRSLLAAAAASPLATLGTSLAADPTQVFTDSDKPTDYRLGPPKTLNDYFPFKVPKTLADWEDRKKRLREQLLVATGLWPLPEKLPLKPVIHGKIERDGYTIEKVFFASMPGHYVSGNLYRPTAKGEAKRPAVLFAHGHWNDGRFYTAPEKEVAAQLKNKAEGTRESALYPLQAPCATLAKLGFVAFTFDMVGYADSTKLAHRTGFTDVEAELRGHNMMGLQTWNMIRAYDFLESLPDVDAKRVGVTGASGGGTQTFLLCAIDDRPAAAFPAVMVSTEMQGGCTCENCSLLRVRTTNVEVAAMFAPKPMAMSCANDWTKNFLKDGYGLPEIKRVYEFYGKPENVQAKAWLEYGHNYNQPAREFMYSWFVKHLMGRDEVIAEPPFVPVPPKELSVYDADPPRPADEKGIAELRKEMTRRDVAWLKSVHDAQDLAVGIAYQQTHRAALRAMVNSHLPNEVVVRKGPLESKHDGFVLHRAIIGRTDEADAVPCLGVIGPKFTGEKVVVWAHPDGKASVLADGKLVPAAKLLLDAGFAILAPDLLGTGEQQPAKPWKVDPTYAGYTFGYNRTLLANRVHDLLTAIGFVKTGLKAKSVHLVGWGEAGLWAVLAKALTGDAVGKSAADLNQFSFEKVTSTNDPMLLPCAVKYGGLLSLLTLCAPESLLSHNAEVPNLNGLSPVKGFTHSAEKWADEKVAAWLVK